jgi:hypothetical protein
MTRLTPERRIRILEVEVDAAVQNATR